MALLAGGQNRDTATVCLRAGFMLCTHLYPCITNGAQPCLLVYQLPEHPEPMLPSWQVVRMAILQLSGLGWASYFPPMCIYVSVSGRNSCRGSICPRNTQDPRGRPGGGQPSHIPMARGCSSLTICAIVCVCPWGTLKPLEEGLECMEHAGPMSPSWRVGRPAISPWPGGAALRHCVQLCIYAF